MWTAYYNHADLAAVFLDNGAAIDERNADGETALIVAASQGSVEAVRVFVERGAEMRFHDGGFRTALVAADLKGHWEVTKVLVAAGGDKAAELDVYQHKHDFRNWWVLAP